MKYKVSKEGTEFRPLAAGEGTGLILRRVHCSLLRQAEFRTITGNKWLSTALNKRVTSTEGMTHLSQRVCIRPDRSHQHCP